MVARNTSVLLSLDGFNFSTNTVAFESLREVVDYGWQSLSRTNKMPLLQAGSRAERTIEIEGVVYPLYAGYTSLDALQSLADRRVPLRLVSGNSTGKNQLGFWVVKQFRRTDALHVLGGQPQRQRFTLLLSYYGARSG